MHELALANMRNDLGFASPTPEQTRRMKQKLEAAAGRIARKGVALELDKAEDLDLLVGYAVWLYRNADGSVAMPSFVDEELRVRRVDEVVRHDDCV